LSEYTAEWILERSGFNCPPRLANFGTAAFSNALLKAGDNTWHPISYNSYVIDDMYANTGTLLAQTSGLSSGNTAFSVQWHNVGNDRNPLCN
jgi:hypothetical protein